MSLMMRARIGLVLSCGVLLSACVMDTVNGSGIITTESRSVSGFSRVVLSGSGRLRLDQAGTESVSVTADDNLLPYIKTDMHGDTLELGFDDSFNGARPTRDVVFTVSARQLEELRVSGSGFADAKNLDSGALTVTISGSGDIVASGHAKDVDVLVSGSGGYRGGGLNSEHARVHVSGSGDVLVAATDTLDASVSGSGNVRYVGTPRVSEHVSGSGSVRPR